MFIANTIALSYDITYTNNALSEDVNSTRCGHTTSAYASYKYTTISMHTTGR